ncbi:hypothetical protein AEAC466_11470 [Asticcacaulis sp. AC466]|uniref:hypothetical protein n=1 Tax=Asticcacaulis sp. AC466 TaxID=1282362 RepID=UPI0003C3FE91|nr:hypothetical protein [Asticcacaulis sp. AC466]ESQ83940.1 hypothetical protein AEAC466_11470 [Asticcacaulis sp. AC466]
MLQSVATQVGAAAILIVCLSALIFGAWREKYASFFYLSAYALTLGFGLISQQDRPLYLLLVDLLCVQGFVVVGWKSPHPWPRWALAGQVICMAAALAHLSGLGIGIKTFWTIETIGGWAVLLALLVGTIAAVQARRIAART